MDDLQAIMEEMRQLKAANEQLREQLKELDQSQVVDSFEASSNAVTVRPSDEIAEIKECLRKQQAQLDAIMKHVTVQVPQSTQSQGDVFNSAKPLRFQANGKPICLRCNKPGHIARFCRVNLGPKAPLARNGPKLLLHVNESKLQMHNGLKVPDEVREQLADVPQAPVDAATCQAVAAFPSRPKTDLQALQAADPVIGGFLPYWKRGCPPTKHEMAGASKGTLVYRRSHPAGRHKIQDAWDPTIYAVVENMDEHGRVYKIRPRDGTGPEKILNRAELKAVPEALITSPIPLNPAPLEPGLMEDSCQESNVHKVSSDDSDYEGLLFAIEPEGQRVQAPSHTPPDPRCEETAVIASSTRADQSE
ncbi:uncharacterized protein V6R79_009959 [Siganus canaliculatus]